MKKTNKEIIVIGAGPGGYTAAFYAADQGKSVTLIEQDDALGGVCLNRGCIPSKALLNAAHSLEVAEKSKERGIDFGKPKIDFSKLMDWKNGILSRLSGGIRQLAKQRKVEVITGRAYFESNEVLRVETTEGQQLYTFDQCIIAVGSKPAIPKAFDLGNKRIMTSTEALNITELPKRLLVVGGGYIGMELGTVYASFGAEVTVVEALDRILAGADQDLAQPVLKYAKSVFKDIQVNTKVIKMATKGKEIQVVTEHEGKSKTTDYDAVLVSIGRVPNAEDLGLENTDIKRDDRGYIIVDAGKKTSLPNIYAIGDIAGGLMLAHKASKEAKIAVESIFGESASPTEPMIPAVVFTHPEVAWVGLTESEAKAKNIAVKVAKFPWGASGRALTLDQPSGLTKLVVDPATDRILGVGIVGAHAGDLISEGVLAVEMQATVSDLADVVHPHPTLSETMMEAAEAFLGHSTHVFNPKGH